MLPQNSGLNYGGIHNLPPGIYGIVENATATYDEDDEDCDDSELVQRIQTEVHKVNGKVHDLVFYLADVEAFHSPAIVVPDIGGPENGYLVLKNRPEWNELFQVWLDSPHEDDAMSDLEEEGEEEEDEEESIDGEEGNGSGEDPLENSDSD